MGHSNCSQNAADLAMKALNKLPFTGMILPGRAVSYKGVIVSSGDGYN